MFIPHGSMLRFGQSFAGVSSSLRHTYLRVPALLTNLSPARFPASHLSSRLNSPLFLSSPRFASTQSKFSEKSQVSTPPNPVNSHNEQLRETTHLQLTWNQFFRLRKQRRFVGTCASIFTALTASAVAFQYFANLVIDFNQMFMGIEMQWIYLAGIVLSGIVGWLLGPLLGNGVFKLVVGAKGPLFLEMDNVFLRHVARNRPNPTKHNVNTNPLPDYYGEKISSLHDYRQWLREGRLFMKKAEEFF